MLLKLVTLGTEQRTYKELGEALGMSPSEVHTSIKRATKAGLLDPNKRIPNRAALLEFLVHGLRYVFWAERGRMTRGLPTAHAAPPLAALLAQGAGPPPVWPDPEGTVRGEELKPLHKAAPQAARKDPALYEFLALADALRSGRARERKLATRELEKRLA